MLRMTQLLFRLTCLMFAAETITSSQARQDCAFVPGPIAASNDTIIATVDCHRRPPDEVGLHDTTGDYTGLVVYLYNCLTVPVGLFDNFSVNLSTVTVVSEDSEELLAGAFEGLDNIAELRLEGFQSLSNLSSAVFRPLRNLERLVLAGFGATRLTYAQLGSALSGLSGTPLKRIVMHRIHSRINTEKLLDLRDLFPLRNVSVREVSFSENIVTSVTGQLSQLLPDLNYVCVGMNSRYYTAASALLDVWFLLPQLQTLTVYSYPVPDTANVNDNTEFDFAIADPTIVVFINLFRNSNCYAGLLFPITRSLRRLTVRNLQLLGSVIDKPICFYEKNNIEYMDFAGSPLPTNTTLVSGLNRLKYLDLQNTGIASLPYEFFGYYPMLEGVKLNELSIGEWMARINSSYFGQCPTLREIHLGDCQLTMIPSDAFSLLPSLRTLNLSSNSLRTFHVSIGSSSNLTNLNLSGNAISSLSEDVLAELNIIAQRRLQEGEILTLDLRGNPSLSCLCNSTHFVRQLQRWVVNKEANVPGFGQFRCLYPNASIVAMSRVNPDQSEKQCGVISEIRNGSDCPCDDDLRQRLELVRLSLLGYFCRNSDGNLMPMTVQPLPGCPDFFAHPTFIAPVVVGGILALSLIIAVILFYRYRKMKRVSRILRRIRVSRVVRVGVQYVMQRNRREQSNFEHDVFLYIEDNDQDIAGLQFDVELVPHRKVIRQDDFRVGLKLETQLEDIQSCRWLVPVLSRNFVDDPECCDFIARAQYTRPHAIVPVVWTPFHTDNLTINSLLNTAEPVKWPGDGASDVENAAFWNALLERTGGKCSAAL